MLSGLFKSGWQSESAEKRLLAIARMDVIDSKSQIALETLALEDSEPEVRQAAIEKIAQPATLLQISQTHTDAGTVEIANARFIKLIGPKSCLTKSELSALGDSHPTCKTLLAQHCPHAELRHSLLADMSEMDQARLIEDVDYADTRKLISEQLVSKQALELARKSIKGKDKSAEKTIKQKLDRIRADDKLAQDNQAAAEAICVDMEFVANHPEWRPEFKERFLRYDSAWQSLGFAPSDSMQLRYSAAQKNAAAKVEQQTLVEAAQKTQLRITESLQDYCKELTDDSMEQIAEKKTVLSDKLSTALSEWLKQSEVATPDSDIAKVFLVAQKALTSVIDLGDSVSRQDNTAALGRSIKQLQWPKHYPTLKAFDEAKALIAEQKKQNKQAQQSEAAKLDSLHKRISRLLSSSKRGDIKQAKQELAATTKIASHFSGKDKLALDERLAQATESVNKMADWQDFATEPKLIELCEAMEKLCKATDHPDKLTKKINTLQQRWKSLGHSDITDQHWERFKAAADTAYEPCSTFFKERRETQRANLVKREPMIKRMQELLENTPWTDAPDYKKVEIELRNINNDWQKIKNVEQGPGQKQWTKLSKIRDEVYQHLDLVYDANLELKHKIISQVEALAETDIKEESIDKLKLFQNRWKQVGITRRKQDQAAWKKFKHASDQVYAKVQGVRQEVRAEEDAQLKGYRDIIKQIQSIAKSATDIANADKEIDSLQSDYQALPPLPKNLPEKLIKGIAADFQRALTAYEKTKERLHQEAKSKILDKLTEKAALCAQLELLDADAPADRIDALRSEIDAIELHDKALNQQFETRLNAALDADKQNAYEARRRMCIDLEIQLGVDSPADDKSLRMQIQLEQMKEQGIGHNLSEKNARTNQLRRDWLCLPGAKADLQSALEQRFNDLVEKHR